MFTEQEVEKFAEWLIKIDDQRMAQRYPAPAWTEKLTDEELLNELFR